MTISNSGVLKDTADIRAKLLEIWRLVDEKKISSSEARLHISVARAILDTLKVEMAAAHLAQSAIPSVSIGRPLRMRDQ
jgi:predicted DNA-binding protein (UPF0251 family)